MSSLPAHSPPPALRPADDAGRTRGIQMMVLGAVVAVLAPLGGFLGGSIVGTEVGIGEIDAMFLWLFAGLVVGGIGAVIALLGLLKWVRAARTDQRPLTS